MNTKFESFKSVLLSVVFFLTLVLFLPFTQDQFVTTKWYFLGFSVLLLLLLSVVQFAISKKISWVKRDADRPLFLFVVAVGLSVLFMSPSFKVQALFQPYFGLLTFVFLFAFYLFLSRTKKHVSFLIPVLAVLSVLLSAITLCTSISVISTHLPFATSFIKQMQYFSPVGSLVDTLVVLGFASVVLLGTMLKQQKESNKGSLIVIGAFVINMGTFIALSFTIIRNPSIFVFPPLSLSWYSAVETLKKPLTALLGVGVDNFPVMFAKVKDTAYNQSVLWQIPTFNVSRSAILHIATETGLLGLISFILVMVQMVKLTFGSRGSVTKKLVTLFFVAAVILFPPSFILFFLFFSYVGFIQMGKSDEEKVLDLKDVIPAYVGLLLLGVAALGAGGFLLVRTYSAEVKFNKALKNNNLKDVYENMRGAVLDNPYYEKYRSNFAQVNLLIANNIAQNAQQAAAKESSKQTLTEEQRQTISQAIQDAIKEGQAVVSLNNQKAANWALLGAIYRNIINVAQGADSWTVSAYQRAVVLDPQNAAYRVELGGVMYTLKNYDEALQLFQQAVALKPDWANAQYNYAWAAYQKEDYVKAANAMQNTVSLLDQKKDAADYKRASADLEEFKSKLPKTEEPTKTQTQEQNKLSLPQASTDSLEPKITLPKTASPEAK